MASGPITSWEIDGETVETMSDFILGGSKIAANGDCSHEIKRRLFLGRKVMTNLDSILKSRVITLPTKFHVVKAMVFPVVMYGCESWTIKKAEHQRIDAFRLWCWRRLLRVPWTASRSHQAILNEINSGYSLEGLMLRMKLQTFGHLMQRADSLEETLMFWKIEGRRRGWQRMRWLDGITDSTDVSLSELRERRWTGRPGVLFRLVIIFLLMSKHLLISWLQSPSAAILEPPQNKVWHCFHYFPIYFPWSDETRCHDLHFLNVEL